MLLHLDQVGLALLLGSFQSRYLFTTLLLFEVQHRQVLFVGAFLFPLDAVPLHHGGKLLFLGVDPLVQLGFSLGAACKAQGLQSLLQGNLGVQSFAFPAGHIRHEVDVQMGRSFVHVEESPEHPQCRVPLLEALHILVQQFLCQCAILGQDTHIIFVADLDDQLMEKLFLLACLQVLIVVGDTAVLALLLVITQFIPVHNIQAAALRVYVFSGETSPVMVEGAGTPHCGNSSFQSHVLSLWK